MDIKNFFTQFPDNDACKMHLKKGREGSGIRCKKCQQFDHFWLDKKWQWQCRNCKFRTTLKSGTIMENSKMSIYNWYLVMAIMTMTKKGCSAKEIQRQVGHKNYEPIWLMMHKIRKLMGKNNILFEEVSPVFEEEMLTILGDDGKEKGKVRLGFFGVNWHLRNKTKTHLSRIILIDPENFESFQLEREKIITPEKSIRGDMWRTTPFANLKRVLFGIHHQIRKKYLQQYLDEFSYKLNRCTLPDCVFDNLMLDLFSPDLLIPQCSEEVA